MSGSQQLLLGGNPQAVPVDPYFYSVTSLLHGDGTNGGQNNTFLDSSTNNFTITRNGNTTQGSFSPFSQTGWSNYFDGSGDSLSLASSSTLALGNGDFTLEFWAYSVNNTSGSDKVIFDQAASNTFLIYIESSDGSFVVRDYGVSNIFSIPSFPLNAWTHVALARSGTTLKLFINGIQVGSVTNSTNLTQNGTYIGQFNGGGENFNGYISNFRLVKGTAVYTSNFTVPTTPLTAITNTSLLTCQANRFLDASSNNFTITRNGDTSIQPFSPFNPTTAYSTSAVGGSGYFDGSGDYLRLAYSSALQFTGNFTIEFWAYPLTQVSSYAGVFNNYSSWPSSTGVSIFCGHASAGSTKWAVALFSTFPAIQTSADYIKNAWSHIALVRNGTGSNNITLYVNGVASGTFTSNNTVTGTADYWWVGTTGDAVSTQNFTGYLTDFRAVGSAVYTANFTPPSAPLTAVSNTQLLLSNINGAIFDNAAVADYETVGNAQISTSVKKYGTGSIAFDGTGDKLVTPFFPWLQMGSSDWTIEMWVYLNSAPGGGAYYGLYANRASTAAYSPITIFVNSARQIEAYFSTSGSSWTSTLTTGQAIPTTTWTHVAVVKIGTLVKVYFNGNGDGNTATISGSLFTNTAQLWVGGENGGNDLNGYIDDFRISKGIARYPYNFTPPTAEFPNIGGTVTLTADPYFDYTTLLLPGNGTNGAQNNTFLDSSTNAFSITRNGNTTQGTFSPFSQTGWGNYFDGTGDYLTTNATQAIPATGDFTVDGWIWCNSYANGPSIISQGTAGTSGRTVIYITTAGKLALQITSTINEFGSAIPTNQWVYFAITRTGSTVTAYMNDTSLGTATNSGSIQNTTLTIGGEWNGDPYRWVGYLSNIRVSNVVRTITAAPTAAFTSDANTVVLTCQSNRFIDASSNAYTITRNGDVSVQAFSPFNPTAAWSAATNGGSGYFDGSGDYLTIGTASGLNFGTGDFTLETWFYLTSTANTDQGIMSDNGGSFAAGSVIFKARQNFYSGHVTVQSYDFNSGGTPLLESTTVVVSNTWYHVAVVRSGNSFSLYVNGAREDTETFTGSINFNNNSGTNIGRSILDGASGVLTGYLSSLRAIKGTAQYSGTTLTVPTAPLTAITNTSLLCNFTNAGIYDATSKNDLETVGNAQISTTQSKFGGSSMYFDGTGDWLLAPSRATTSLEGDFTIEGWAYLSSTAAAWPVITIGDSNTSTGIELYRATSTGKWRVYNNNTSQIESATSTSTGSWVHLAIARYNGVVRLYINGINEGSTWSTTGTFSGAVYVAAEFFGGSVTVAANGYLQDVRITKGIARYTSNFTPPTTAFLTL